MRNLTASDRSALIKLASSLPAGSPERKAILAGLQGSSKTAAGKSIDPILEAAKKMGRSIQLITKGEHLVFEGQRYDFIVRADDDETLDEFEELVSEYVEGEAPSDMWHNNRGVARWFMLK